jgi:hypothetical protein
MNLYLLKKIGPMMGHKQGVSCEMLSCAPSKCSPWPYCLMKTTLPSHEKQGLEPLHGTTGG